MQTLAICDTEPVAMAGMRSLFEFGNGWRVVACSGSLPEALKAARELNPDLIIVDKTFGMQPVIDWLRALRSGGSPAGVIVWGTSLSGPEALRLLTAGARGVLRKTAPLPALLECARAVAAGSNWLEPDLVPGAEAAPNGRPLALTSREMQILDLVERGEKNRQIAATLGIQTGTVKIHLKHIFEKTGVRGRYGLALARWWAKQRSAAAEPAIAGKASGADVAATSPAFRDGSPRLRPTPPS